MELRAALLLWISLISKRCGPVNSETSGVDIGHRCRYDKECTRGNGGEYSKCNQVLSICICTINILGEDKCREDSDQYDGVCRRPLIYDKIGQCTLECSPIGTRKWKESEDWYGEIIEDFALYIQDKKTSVCYDPRRAFNSLPDGFEIKQSTIPNAGLGAFANVFIQQDTVLGPYKGIFEPDSDTATISGYSWKITVREGEDRTDTEWVDAKDVTQSNWLRYGNTPTSASMENVVAFQHKGEMFYQAFKYIEPGTELLVWYGDGYGEFLGIEEFKPPSYYNSYPGYVGGECHLDDSGTPCLHDDNTVCAGETCFCVHGTHNRAGKCIRDETLGGICTGSDGDTCKQDTNAECQRGVCVCKNISTPANGMCRLDETFGGLCAGRNGERCLRDNNTVCVDGLCRCRYGTTGINGKCMQDEEYQGRCIGEDGEDCVADQGAECRDGICVCKANSSVINGKCVFDEIGNGKCKGLDGQLCARDGNAVCIGGFCICTSKTSNVNGVCRINEKLGGRCKSGEGAKCKKDNQAICVNGICTCKKGKSDIGGICVTDGAVGGVCLEEKCNGQSVFCDSESNRCICQPEHFSYAGRCVKKRSTRLKKQ